MNVYAKSRKWLEITGTRTILLSGKTAICITYTGYTHQRTKRTTDTGSIVKFETKQIYQPS